MINPWVKSQATGQNIRSRALKEGIVNICWSYLFSPSQYPGAAPEGTDCRSQLLAADQQEDSMVRVEHHKTGAPTNPQP